MQMLTQIIQQADPFEIGSSQGYQQWLSTGMVDFLEVFSGEEGLSLAIHREGHAVGQSIDRLRMTYGQRWDLVKHTGRRRLIWLIVVVLRPKGCHVATPCDPWCVLGTRVPDATAFALADFSSEILHHQ